MKRLALLVLILPGCTSLDALLYQQALDYNETVVERVLLPHYLEDPQISNDQKQNVSAAVREHSLFLAEVKGAAEGVGP